MVLIQVSDDSNGYQAAGIRNLLLTELTQLKVKVAFISRTSRGNEKNVNIEIGNYRAANYDVCIVEGP